MSLRILRSPPWIKNSISPWLTSFSSPTNPSWVFSATPLILETETRFPGPLIFVFLKDILFQFTIFLTARQASLSHLWGQWTDHPAAQGIYSPWNQQVLPGSSCSFPFSSIHHPRSYLTALISCSFSAITRSAARCSRCGPAFRELTTWRPPLESVWRTSTTRRRVLRWIQTGKLEIPFPSFRLILRSPLSPDIYQV